MVVGGWSSADGRQPARRSSRFGTDASPRDVGVHARETLGETRGDVNGATRSVAGTLRGASNAVLIGVASSLSSSFSSVCEVSSRGSSSTRFSGGWRRGEKPRRPFGRRRGSWRARRGRVRRERRGLRTGAGRGRRTRHSGRDPAGVGRRTHGRAHGASPRPETTASPDAHQSRAAREYRAARSTRVRPSRPPPKRDARPNLQITPRTRVWTGPRPPHSERGEPRATVRLPSVAGRMKFREFQNIPKDDFSSMKMNLESQTNGAATLAPQTLLSRTP